MMDLFLIIESGSEDNKLNVNEKKCLYKSRNFKWVFVNSTRDLKGGSIKLKSMSMALFK